MLQRLHSTLHALVGEPLRLAPNAENASRGGVSHRPRLARAIAFVASFALAASLVPATALTAFAATNHSGHSGWTVLTADMLSGKEEIQAGRYYLSGDVTLLESTDSYGYIISDDVTICLNGSTLDVSEGRLHIADGGSLTICDCAQSGSKGCLVSNKPGDAVTVSSGAELLMTDCVAKLKNGTVTSSILYIPGGDIKISGSSLLVEGEGTALYVSGGNGLSLVDSVVNAVYLYGNTSLSVQGKVNIGRLFLPNSETKGMIYVQGALVEGSSIAIDPYEYQGELPYYVAVGKGFELTNSDFAMFSCAEPSGSEAKRILKLMDSNAIAIYEEGHEAFLVNVEKSDNGSVSVADDKELATEGETVTLTPTADENYKLKSLTVKDDSGSSVNVAVGQDGSYSFTMPASDVTVAAEFGRDYSINVVDPLPDGAKYITSDTIKAEAGTSVSGTIAAEDGWVLKGVTVTPVSGSAFEVTAGQDGSYVFTMPESDVTVSAEFKQTQVGISITDEGGNALAGATVELRDEGNNVVGTGWTSAATAQVIKELAAGTYTIVVTAVPQGYLVPTANTTFTMGADGTVSVNGSVAADGKVAVKLDSATAYSLTPLQTEHGTFSFVVNGQVGATQAYEGDTVTVYFEAEAEYGFYNLTVTNASTGVSVHEMAYENSSPGLAETDRELSKVDASSTADEKALFTFTMPAGNVNASMTFNHICGYYNPSIKVVGDMSLNDWYAQQTAANPNAASYELPNGYYYLEESLEVSVPICFASGSYSSTPTLDLNGKTINFVDGAYLQVNDGVVAGIRDCKHVADADGTQASGGLLKRAAADASGSPALVVGEGSTIYLFGGKIQGAQTAGTLDFRNGEIYAEGANAAVSVIGSGSISFMDGVISAPDGVGVQGGGDKKISLNSAKILAKVDLEPVWGTTVYATYGSLAGDFVLGGQPEVGDEYMIVKGSESYPSYSLTYDDLTKLSFNADSRLYDFWIDADANAIMFKLYPHIGFDSDGDGVDDKYVTDPDDGGIYKDEDGTSYIPDQDGDGKPEADSDDDGVYEGSGNPSDDEGNFYRPTDTDDDGIEDDVFVDSNGDGEFGPDENGNGIEDAVETGGSGDGTTGSGDGVENDGATAESDREAEGDSSTKKPVLAATGDVMPVVAAGLALALLGGLALALRARRMVG